MRVVKVLAGNRVVKFLLGTKKDRYFEYLKCMREKKPFFFIEEGENEYVVEINLFPTEYNFSSEAVSLVREILDEFSKRAELYSDNPVSEYYLSDCSFVWRVSKDIIDLAISDVVSVLADKRSWVAFRKHDKDKETAKNE